MDLTATVLGTDVMSTTQNTITLHRSPDSKCWFAVFSGPHAAEIIDLFDTAAMPLPWCHTARAEDVLRSQVKANPDCKVLLSDVEV